MLRSLVGSEMCIRDRFNTNAAISTEAYLLEIFFGQETSDQTTKGLYVGMLSKKLLGEANSLLGARIRSQRAEHEASPLVRSYALNIALVDAFFGAGVNSAPTSASNGGTGAHGVLGAGEVGQLVRPAGLATRGSVKDDRTKVGDGHLTHTFLDPEISLSASLLVLVSVSVSLSVSLSVPLSASFRYRYRYAYWYHLSLIHI